MRKVWYKVMVSYDAATGRGFIAQIPYLTATNGGHGMSMLHPREDTEAARNFSAAGGPARTNDCPFMMAASAEQADCGRAIYGGHYAHLGEPWSIPAHTQKFNGLHRSPRASPGAR